MVSYKIVVNGGLGFIGTNLIEKFIFEGHVVLNLDIIEPKKVELLKLLFKDN